MKTWLARVYREHSLPRILLAEARTRSEARAQFKAELGVPRKGRLPLNVEVVRALLER
jgi:hypothetical protein